MPNNCNLTLEGHLGKDAEVRMSSAGNPIVSFSVAFSQGKKDDPNKKPATWFNCRVVGAAARGLEDLRKGEAVTISKAIPETWKDNNGNDRITWIVFEAEKWQKREDAPPQPEPAFNDVDVPF